MVAVLDELELTELACSHRRALPGRGRRDPGRDRGPDAGSPPPGPWSNTPAWHPARRKSGTFTGRARLTGAGRPLLRAAAWRAVWGCLQDQPGVRRPLPAPDHPRDQQAQAHPGPDRVAAAILRQLHAVVTHRPGLGPRRRRPRHPTTGGGCRITRSVA